MTIEFLSGYILIEPEKSTAMSTYPAIMSKTATNATGYSKINVQYEGAYVYETVNALTITVYKDMNKDNKIASGDFDVHNSSSGTASLSFSYAGNVYVRISKRIISSAETFRITRIYLS